MGKIFYIIGKSSSGKDTIFKRLLEKYPDFHTIVTYTTRPKREGEVDGVEYFFVDDKKLKELKNAGKVIEVRSYNTKCGIWRYFTVDDRQINLSAYDYLLIGTLESYVAVKKYFGKDSVIPLYIEVEDGLRLTRALEREKKQNIPQYAEMCRRFLADQCDFSDVKIREAGISVRFNNTDLNACIENILQYMHKFNL